MIDAVLSYHADPISCGVTRFSQQLAKRLDVPWDRFTKQSRYDWKYPLISMKPSEFEVAMYWPNRFDAFFHEVSPAYVFTKEQTPRVFAGSAAIADGIRKQRPDVIPAWCPSLVEAQPREPITVLSFGMAHKLRTDLYATLKEKLEATGEPYVVYVSAALHDGTSFADAAQNFDVLRKLFGRNFVFLGTLSDEAMVDRLRTCTYVAAFFEKGLRENNTSVMAALEHGSHVITNYDSETPDLLRSLCYDIHYDGLPHHNRRILVQRYYGWDSLVRLIHNA